MSPPETYRGENLTPGGMLAFEALGLKGRRTMINHHFITISTYRKRRVRYDVTSKLEMSIVFAKLQSSAF